LTKIIRKVRSLNKWGELSALLIVRFALC